MLKIYAVITCDQCNKRFDFPAHPLGQRSPVYPERLRGIAAQKGWWHGGDQMDLCPNCVRDRESNIEV